MTIILIRERADQNSLSHVESAQNHIRKNINEPSSWHAITQNNQIQSRKYFSNTISYAFFA